MINKMVQTTLNIEKTWLWEDILRKKGEDNIFAIPIPQEVIENLNPNLPIRDYQNKAFQMFISYYEQYQEKPDPKAVLFNMATGSGKTLIMAGLIIYLFKKGYNNFLFFVNSNNIIEKTKDNFFNPKSIKYLLNEKITIDGKLVTINEVDNFDSSNKNDINICFTTIQKLHGDLHAEKENALSFDNFKDKKIVLIADEAHHGQVQTKQRMLSNDKNWENTIEEILKKDRESLLLEFTATMGFENNPEIKNKYLKRLLYKYDLPHFRNAGFSKDIELFRVDGDKKYRMLTAVLISQYRQDIASKYAKLFPESYGLKNFKPVILFKAQKEIKESLENNIFFRDLIDNLKNKDIEEVKNKSNELIMNQLFDFYEKEGISITNLIKKLQMGFSERNCLNANEESLDKKSISQKDKEELISQERILNSLEESKNPIRAIFAVQKLNEGWDVLNLFDIVRVSDKQAGGGGYRGGVSQSTISEAQLIGRGARYYPFKLEESQELFKRKFDEDIQNELRILEELYYHSWDNSSYIADIKNAIREELGINLDDVEIKELKLKDKFRDTLFYKSGKIYKNKPMIKDYSKIKSFSDLKFTNKNMDYEIYSGKGEVSLAFRDSKYDNSKIIKITKEIPLKDIESHIIKNALSKINFFEFDNLKNIFPKSIESVNDLIERKEFLAGIKINFIGISDDITSITNKQKLDAVFTLLTEIKDTLNKNIVKYEGSDFYEEKISKIFDNKTLKFNKNDPRLNGMEDFIKYRDWYVFNANYGTSEEKACVKFIDTFIESDNFKGKYKEVYLIRNELHFTIHDFDTGEAFAPDFVLFLKDNKGKHLIYQIFIEAKGDLFKDENGTFETGKEGWKQKFLLKIKDKFESQGLKKFIETTNYKVFGVPFYNEELENDFEKEFLDRLKIKK